MIKQRFLEYLRIALYIVAGFLILTVFQLWQTEEHTVTPNTVPTVAPHAMPLTAATTAPAPALDTPAAATAATHTPEQALITVQTDVLDIKIDPQGGNIVESKLLTYTESLENKTPFVLMNNDPKTRYVAESGLIEGTTDQTITYVPEKTQYILAPDQHTLTVTLTGQQNGLRLIKQFIFTRHHYDVAVHYTLTNQSRAPWQGQLYTQLTRSNTPPAAHGSMMSLTTYFGAAISSTEKPFDKITFKTMQTNPLNLHTQGGWAAMIQHYFISAWIPPQATFSTYYTRTSENQFYTVGMISDVLVVQPSHTLTMAMQLYTGPAIASLLNPLSPTLKLTIDYGWFWFISDIIFWMMQKIYNVVHNWGWSIVLVTLIIKVLFYKLSDKSYRSMNKLKKLQPRIEALRERYANDKQKLTQAMLELYRQEKVNPMGGCLPILIQIPVFIALYWVLVESVQLRQAPFILWIHDLSKGDPYYVLPLLMGIAMFVQQRLNPPPPDPMQAKMMMFMPVVFTFLFANFPAGLMLYWFVNNLLSCLQQWFLMRHATR